MKRFKRIYIEITNACNLDCSFCPKHSRKIEFMTPEVFRDILKEVSPYSGHIYFHVMGEPLMHPDIDVFLDMCQEYGCKANITTNGILIKDVKDKVASKPALRMMNFSMHILDENMEEKKINAYLDEVFSFTNAAVAAKPDFITCLRLWNQDGLSQKNRHIIERVEEKLDLPKSIQNIPVKGNGIKLTNNIYINQASEFDWPDRKIDDISENGFCLGMRDQIAILVDGTVVPCCLDSEGTIALGNIKEIDFLSIIEGKRATDLYNGFSERKAVEPLCRKCGYRKRFD